MKPAKRFLTALAGKVPFLFPLPGRTSAPLILPFYHAVEDTPSPLFSFVMDVPTTDRFREDLTFLLERFEPLSLDQVKKAHLGEEPLKRPSFHLSFDDGLRSCREVIAPILREKGVPATFFLNTDFIGNKGASYRFLTGYLLHWLRHKGPDDPGYQRIKGFFGATGPTSLKNRIDRTRGEEKDTLIQAIKMTGTSLQHLLEEYRPYMTWDEVRKLHAEGFSIGSHGRDHRPFQTMDETEIHQTMKESFQALEEGLGPLPHRVFSFPFSDDGISTETLNALIKDNHLDLLLGSSGFKAGKIPRHLQRIPAEHPEFSLKTLIRGEIGAYRMKRTVFRKR